MQMLMYVMGHENDIFGMLYITYQICAAFLSVWFSWIPIELGKD